MDTVSTGSVWDDWQQCFPRSISHCLTSVLEEPWPSDVLSALCPWVCRSWATQSPTPALLLFFRWELRWDPQPRLLALREGPVGSKLVTNRTAAIVCRSSVVLLQCKDEHLKSQTVRTLRLCDNNKNWSSSSCLNRKCYIVMLLAILFPDFPDSPSTSPNKEN